MKVPVFVAALTLLGAAFITLPHAVRQAHLARIREVASKAPPPAASASKVTDAELEVAVQCMRLCSFAIQ